MKTAIHDDLQQLRTEIATLDTGPQRQRLESLLADLERQLGDDEPDLRDTVESAIAEFELDYPKFSAVLKNILHTLGNMGI